MLPNTLDLEGALSEIMMTIHPLGKYNLLTPKITNHPTGQLNTGIMYQLDKG